MISRRRFLAASAAAALLPSAARAAGAPMPIFDAHIHFSHDAAERLSAGEAVAILERAGLKRALVSSSGDAGTRALHAAAPNLALPSLRPYRRRGRARHLGRRSIGDRLPRRPCGSLPVGRGRRIPPLRRADRQGRAAAHGRARAAAQPSPARQFGRRARSTRSSPSGRKREFYGPHAGFVRSGHRRRDARKAREPVDRPRVPQRARLRRPGRRRLAEPSSPPSPDRVMVGTDTFTPERWHHVVEHADWTREWLTDLPPDLAEKIAWRNGEGDDPAAPCATRLARGDPVAPWRTGAGRHACARPRGRRGAGLRPSGGVDRRARESPASSGRHGGDRNPPPFRSASISPSAFICAGRRSTGSGCAAGCRITGTA